jgi:hypothetical protein
MPNTSATSTDSRSQVHTEVRVPMETVMTRVIWFVFGVIEVLIAVRFGLMLLGAQAGAGFVRFVYGASGIFMAPFVAIFKTQAVTGGSVFEWSALLAIAIYALIAWGLVSLIHAVGPREHSETVERVVQDDGVTAAR